MSFVIGSTANGTTTADGNAEGTTLIQTGRSEADRYFAGMLIKITNGACVNQKRLILSWVKTTGTFTISSAAPFTAKIVAGTTFQFVNVTLPQYPHKFKEKNPSETKVRPLSYNALPFVMAVGRGLRAVELEVLLFNPGYTNAQLLSTYVIPLRELSHTVVVVSSADAFYDGNYLMDSFDPEPQTQGVVKATIKLVQGSQMYSL
jgi:hypothetical protein